MIGPFMLRQDAGRRDYMALIDQFEFDQVCLCYLDLFTRIQIP
jgi:hypothetical protein